MRRADRLFVIVQYLRSRRLTTADWLADKLGVSVRTVYRDIQDLSRSGVPVEGEAGVGYALRHSIDLPPLQFTPDEAMAIDLGLRIVEAQGPVTLAQAASTSRSKVRTILPKPSLAELERSPFRIPALGRPGRERIAPVDRAIRDSAKLRLLYRDQQGAQTERTVRPLAIFYWGSTWVLTAWCELREDFRNFRLDRIMEACVLPESFTEEPGKSLQDYFRRVAEQHGLPRRAFDSE